MKRLKRTLENLASAVAFAEGGCRDEALKMADALDPIRRSTHAKVILASTGRNFSGNALDYMAGLMDRMHCDVLALSTQPHMGPRSGEEHPGAGESIKALSDLAEEHGSVCLHRTVAGGLCGSILKYCRLIRDVRFAVVQARKGDIDSCALPIPVFYIHPGKDNAPGGGPGGAHPIA